MWLVRIGKQPNEAVHAIFAPLAGPSWARSCSTTPCKILPTWCSLCSCVPICEVDKRPRWAMFNACLVDSPSESQRHGRFLERKPVPQFPLFGLQNIEASLWASNIIQVLLCGIPGSTSKKTRRRNARNRISFGASHVFSPQESFGMLGLPQPLAAYGQTVQQHQAPVLRLEAVPRASAKGNRVQRIVSGARQAFRRGKWKKARTWLLG